MEFLIVCNEHGGWELQFERLGELFRPATLPHQTIAGTADHVFMVEGQRVATFLEMPGIQVLFEDSTDHALALRITHDILVNMESFTGQKGQVLDFSGELEGQVISFE